VGTLNKWRTFYNLDGAPGSTAAPAAAAPSSPQIPAPLAKFAPNLDWSSRLQQFRDRTTNKVYDAHGNPVE
jgi:hypothetical protein